MLRMLTRGRSTAVGASARRHVVAIAVVLAVALLAVGCSVIATLHADQNRDPVPLAQISPLLQTAVVAAEDARFFDHEGVDPRSVIRALVHDSEQGSLAEGGSTIFHVACDLSPKAAPISSRV